MRAIKEYVMWGIPQGETERHMEVLLAEGLTSQAQVDRVRELATADGYHGLRVWEWDGSTPDFTRALNRKKTNR